MGRATSKGNEAKSNTKQPLDMPTPRFEHGGCDLWTNTLLLDYGGTPIHRHGSAYIITNLYGSPGLITHGLIHLMIRNRYLAEPFYNAYI